MGNRLNGKRRPRIPHLVLLLPVVKMFFICSIQNVIAKEELLSRGLQRPLKTFGTGKEKVIQLDRADVKNIKLHNLKKYALIEITDFSTATRFDNKHNNCQHSLECNEIHYKISVFVESSVINVRIHDVPPQMPNAVIFYHMQQSDKVTTVYNEVFKQIPNGVKVVSIRQTNATMHCHQQRKHHRTLL